MHFTKMNGAGNDFIILNCVKTPLAKETYPNLARALCDRRRSIGADALIVVEAPTEPEADFRMRFYNSDGSLGEMCGNGARCISRYGYETGLSGETAVVQTTAGLLQGYRIDRQNYRIRLQDPSVLRLEYPVEVDGVTCPCSYIELGRPGIPHAVLPIEHLADYDERALFELGRKLRYHPEFLKGANVNFYELTGPDEILLRTWERGVEDFTLACGTGTGSVATVLTLKGLCSGKNIKVKSRGGTLTVDIDRDKSLIHNLWLTGPTAWVAEGTFTDEAIPEE